MAATICRREKNIVVEDDDGYEICSDIEIELFCKRKDDPCFVITTTLDADNENAIVALSNSPTRLVTASVVEENDEPLVFAVNHRSVAVNEAEMDVTSEDVIYFENMDEDIEDHVAQPGPNQPAEKLLVLIFFLICNCILFVT